MKKKGKVIVEIHLSKKKKKSQHYAFFTLLSSVRWKINYFHIPDHQNKP